MEYIKNIIERYKRIRSMRQLKQIYGGNYAFVGIATAAESNTAEINLFIINRFNYLLFIYGCKDTKRF